MTERRLATIIFLGAVWFASAASAYADPRQCLAVDDDNVMSTVECEPVIALPPAAFPKAEEIQPVIKLLSPQRQALIAAEKARAAAWSSRRSNQFCLSLDVATSKAAKVAAMESDRASALLRQRGPGKQKASTGWVFWGA
jgi:hypothetical protein